MDKLVEQYEALKTAEQALYKAAEAHFVRGHQLTWETQKDGKTYQHTGTVVETWGFSFDSFTLLVRNNKTGRKRRIYVREILWAEWYKLQ